MRSVKCGRVCSLLIPILVLSSSAVQRGAATGVSGQAKRSLQTGNTRQFSRPLNQFAINFFTFFKVFFRRSLRSTVGMSPWRNAMKFPRYATQHCTAYKSGHEVSMERKM
jgi:hypothetical protein